MGYTLRATVVETGAAVGSFDPGDRVVALAPHAEYVTVETGEVRKAGPEVVRLPQSVSAEAVTLWPFATSCVLWSWSCDVAPTDTVVVQGRVSWEARIYRW
jgi:NADPH:quinone reductase-like Zn-dependent oxidoreductase